MKKCSKCKRELALVDFSKNKSRKYGLRSNCKDCEAQYREDNKKRRKQYLEKNKERFAEWDKQYREKNRDKIANSKTNKKFGVYQSELVGWQGNKCAICQEVENGKKLHVDHDHETGQIRMLLCHGCNTGNKITDNSVLCYAKWQYLESYK